MLVEAEAVNQLVVGSSPTGGATAKPATLFAFSEEFEPILVGDVFKACFDQLFDIPSFSRYFAYVVVVLKVYQLRVFQGVYDVFVV